MNGNSQAASPATPGSTSPAVPAGEHAAREILQALPGAIYTTDADGRITFYNEAAAELWGCRPELGKSEFCGSWKLYWPDGTPLPHDQCPMAQALKQGKPIRGMEAVAERPDGTRVPFIPYPTPLFDAEGRLTGAVNMLVDISDRHRAEQLALAEAGARARGEQAAQRLAAIVESSEDAIVAKDLNGIITDWNRGAERLFGHSAREVVGQPITIVIPPDRLDEEPEILARIRRGERVEHFETVRRRKDGSLVEISLTISPIRSRAGEIVGASKIARDITERKRAEDRQTLLLREMSHRVKNLFALAGAVITLSARTARTPEELAEQVRNRLGTLARAHDLTLPDLRREQAVTPTTLATLLRTIVSPFEDSNDGRVTIAGPEVTIGGHAVTSLALLLHELATNAAKYGALSAATGRIAVVWTIEEGVLSLSWTERDGPPADGTANGDGFGTWLVDGTVKGQLQGQIARRWDAAGLTILMTMPLDRLAG
ncbi:PAS domain S-box-containing protein [Inquilinus ginsengisoli]|uniref:PAS domain S-box protein n=1 Tax=Inquilinus ginsengisoli TaxID=363840 RepID=UPI003D1D6323